MQPKVKRKHKGIPIEKLETTKLENGKTLDYYLTKQPEKFALALFRAIESMNRFSEHKIVYVFAGGDEVTLHTGILHAGHFVDARGRHRDKLTILEDIVAEDIPEATLELVRQLPVDILERLQQNEDEDELHDELRALQVYIKHDWLSRSNFYIS